MAVPKWEETTNVLDAPAWDDTFSIEEDAPAQERKKRLLDPTVQSVPVPRTASIGKSTSPGLDAYKKSLSAFENGDRSGAELAAKESLKLDPNFTESQRILERLKQDPTAGTVPRGPGPVQNLDDGVNLPELLRSGAVESVRFAKKAMPVPTEMPRTIPDVLKASIPPSPIPKAVEKRLEPMAKGMEVSARQIPQLGYGMAAFAGDTAEKMFGGGVGAKVRDWGLRGYQDAEISTQNSVGDIPSLSASWEKAKGGDINAFVDWVSYGVGYGIGQLGESAAVATVGAILGSSVAPGPGTAGGAVGGAVAKGATKGLIKKAITKLIEKRATAIAGKGVAENVARRLAVKEMAAVAGAMTFATAQNLAMEGGSIYPELVSRKAEKGETVSGSDLARAWGATFAAGGAETLADMLGLGVLTGKIHFPNGPFGKVTKAVLGGFGVGLAEGGTEGVQTEIERFGAQKPITGPEASQETVESAGLGFLGGLIPGVSGAVRVFSNSDNGPTGTGGPGGGPGGPSGGQPVAPLDSVGVPTYPITNGVPTDDSDGNPPGGSAPGVGPFGWDDRPIVPPVAVGPDPAGPSAPTQLPPKFEETLPVTPPPIPGDQPGAPGTEQPTPEPQVVPQTQTSQQPKNPPKKVKQADPLSALVTVASGNKSIPTIHKTFAVRGGVATSTDLEVSLELKSDLPDGVYKMIGKNPEKTQYDTEQFPNTSVITTKEGTVGRDDLINNFARVYKASSGDSTRFVLNSVLLESKGGKARLVATDGRRMSMSPLDTAKMKDGQYTITNVRSIAKALSALSGDTLEVGIQDQSKNVIEFKGQNGRVLVRLVDGNFPNFNQVITEPTKQVSFKKGDIEAALKELTPYANELRKQNKPNSVLFYRPKGKTNTLVLRVSSFDEKIKKEVSIQANTVGGNFGKMSAGSIVMGMKNDKSAPLQNGDNLLFYMNLDYIQDATDSVNGDTVYMGLTDKWDDPVTFRGRPLEQRVSEQEPVKKKRRGKVKGGQASFGGEGIESFEGSESGPARAIFRGWQDQGKYGPPFPLYNIAGNHPKARSTVSAETLNQLGIEVPETPTFEEWKAPKGKKVDQTQTPNVGAFDPENPSILKSPEGPSAESRGIDKFEKLTPGEQEQTFKLFEKVRGLVKKYAGIVGERYLPSGTAGVYYNDSKNIRIKSLNEISVATHEITHAIDKRVGLSDKLNAMREWDVVGGLTEVYTEMYPGGKEDHPVKKRIVEGLATLIQKTAEMPSAMEYTYGDLVRMFTKPGGKHYVKELDMLLNDVRKIVEQFQQLDDLSKVGAFVTENVQQKEARKSFLGWFDKVRTEIFDAIWPIEKAGNIAKVGRTGSDPSLWMRAYQGVSGLVMGNMIGSRGFWVPTSNGELRQVSDKNFSDLVEGLKKRGLLERFGWWLIARDTVGEYKLLDQMRQEAVEAARRLADAKKLIDKMGPSVMVGDRSLADDIAQWKRKIEAFKEKRGVLAREPLARGIWESAYQKNKADFVKESEIFDTFTAANLYLMEGSGLITKTQADILRQKEGYAPKKRDIYDDVLGAERAEMPTVTVGKNKVSSMMSRKGSTLTYLNPVYSVIRDHAEIMRKSTRQMVYNKLMNLIHAFPGVLQESELKPAVDKATGKTTYPQDKDPNIIMARDAQGGRHPLLVGKDMKNVIDDVLQFHSLNVMEQVMRHASQMFSQLTTGTYPFFVLTNISMDIPTAMANTRTKMIPIYDAVRELGRAILKGDSIEHKYAAEWLASHGERQSMTGWQTLDPDELYSLIANEKHWIVSATKKLRDGVDLLSIPGKYSEVMSRMTEYIRSRKAGNPWIVAMEDSARVTTPFVHMGRYGGGTWMKTLIKSIPFYNAGMQALDQFLRTASQKENQQRLVFVMGLVALASVGGMGWLMKRGSDEQKDHYRDLEGKSLTNYIWFPAPDGKGLVKIRVAEQFGWLAALLNLAIAETMFNADYKFHDYTDAATSWAPDQLDITNPVNALINWLPQLIKPAVEVAFDRRTFPTLRTLTPMAMQRIPPGQRSTETTSGFAKKLGEMMDLSPIAIDHLIEGYLGRTSRFFTGRIMNMKVNPFAEDWYFTSGRNLQDFYETKEKTAYLIKIAKTGERKLTSEEYAYMKHNIGFIKVIEKDLDVLRLLDRQNKLLKKKKTKEGKVDLYEQRKRILTNIGKLKP